MEDKKDLSVMQPTEWVEWICSSQNLNEVATKYDQWASTYEECIEDVWQPVPLTAAGLLDKYLNDKSGTILDIGAGTGLVGSALYALGLKNLIALDLSASMLAIAAEKGVYSSQICCSLGDEHLNKMDKVAAMIAVGLFSDTQAGASELAMLPDYLLPNGIIVFTARESFLPQLQPVLQDTRWEELTTQSLPIYEADPMNILCYQIRSID